MGEPRKHIDLIAAAERLPSERRAHLSGVLNGGLFLSHTSADAPFIRRHIEPTATAEFYGAFFFQNQSFPMSDAYEPFVGQALLSCRVMLVAVSKSALCSRYMKAELDVAGTRKMPTVVCRLDGTDPVQLSPLLAKTWNPLRRPRIAFVDFSVDVAHGQLRLQTALARRSFRCTHSMAAQPPAAADAPRAPSR
jgi:hypothetical protein